MSTRTALGPPRAAALAVLGTLAAFTGLACVDLPSPEDLNLEVVVDGVPADANALKVEVKSTEKDLIFAREPALGPKVTVSFASLPAGRFVVSAHAKKGSETIATARVEVVVSSKRQSIALTVKSDACEGFDERGFACPDAHRSVSFTAGALFPLSAEGRDILLAADVSVPSRPLLRAVTTGDERLVQQGAFDVDATLVHPSATEALVLANPAGDSTWELGVVRAPDGVWTSLAAGVRPGRFGYMGDVAWAIEETNAQMGEGELVLVPPGGLYDEANYAGCPAPRQVRGPVARAQDGSWIAFERGSPYDPLLVLHADGTCSLARAENARYRSLGVAADSAGGTYAYARRDISRDVFDLFRDGEYKTTWETESQATTAVAFKQEGLLLWAFSENAALRLKGESGEMTFYRAELGVPLAVEFAPYADEALVGRSEKGVFWKPTGSEEFFFAEGHSLDWSTRRWDGLRLNVWTLPDEAGFRSVWMLNLAVIDSGYQSIDGVRLWDYFDWPNHGDAPRWFAAGDSKFVNPVTGATIEARTHRTYAPAADGLAYIDPADGLPKLRRSPDAEPIVLSDRKAHSVATTREPGVYWIAFAEEARGLIARVGLPKVTP